MANKVAVLGSNMDLHMTRGTNFGPVTVFLTDENDQPIDLTGASITAKMQRTNKTGDTISFGTDIPAPATDGKFVFAMIPGYTLQLSAGVELYDWNLWITRGGVVSPLYYGKVSVQDQVL